MKKRIFGRRALLAFVQVLAFFAIGSGIPASVLATTVNYSSYFLDERFSSFPNVVGSGLRLQVEAGVSDSLGVPGNIASVIARQTTTGLTLLLPYRGLGNFTTPTYGPFFTSPLLSSVPLASRVGSYQISVTNDQGGVVSITTPTLVTSNPLVRAQNIQITGSVLSPTVSWSNVPGADKYEVRIWNPTTSALLFDSPRSTYSTFSIPSGVLAANQTYALGIMSLDTDSFGNLIRRSVEVQSFSPHISHK